MPLEESEEYVYAVLDVYAHLPDTPEYARRADRQVARKLHAAGVSLDLIESAFLLATARRLCRGPTAPRLEPIRSLAYFRPVIEEITQHPFPATYIDYLRFKLRSVGFDDEMLRFGLADSCEE